MGCGASQPSQAKAAARPTAKASTPPVEAQKGDVDVIKSSAYPASKPSEADVQRVASDKVKGDIADRSYTRAESNSQPDKQDGSVVRDADAVADQRRPGARQEEPDDVVDFAEESVGPLNGGPAAPYTSRPGNADNGPRAPSRGSNGAARQVGQPVVARSFTDVEPDGNVAFQPPAVRSKPPAPADDDDDGPADGGPLELPDEPSMEAPSPSGALRSKPSDGFD